MKNTVKKILALVFVVAMVCSLAVPAFAEDETVRVAVKVVLPGIEAGETAATDNVVSTTVTIEAKKATVENVLEKDAAIDKVLDINGSTGKVSAIKVNEADTATTKVTNAAITGEFGTGSVIVAVNGKAVSEDLDTVTVENGDHITVYWADSKLGTKLAMVDDSAIAQGIVSFYYYDAEGNRQPLKGAKVSLVDLAASRSGVAVRDWTNKILPSCKKADDSAVEDKYLYQYHFVTDEKGQIWIAPADLDDAKTYTIQYAWNNVNEVDEDGIFTQVTADKDQTDIIDNLKAIKKDDGYTTKEVTYYNARLNRNIVDVEVIGYEVVVEDDLYNVAGATGDMTVVYALVAFAAVATLAAVVVMKKKSVKAN